MVLVGQGSHDATARVVRHDPQKLASIIFRICRHMEAE